MLKYVLVHKYYKTNVNELLTTSCFVTFFTMIKTAGAFMKRPWAWTTIELDVPTVFGLLVIHCNNPQTTWSIFRALVLK